MPILATDFAKIKNHLSITTCSDVAELMLPRLKQHDVTLFNYYKMYDDGTAIRLSTNRAWSENYFAKGYLRHRSSTSEIYLTKQINYLIWQTEDCPEMLIDAAMNFDISNGISIVHKHKDSIEYFSFGTTRNNKSIINKFYINNLDLLEKYCQLFKGEATNLLQLAEKDKIILQDSAVKIKDNLSFPKNKKIAQLTRRQKECCALLVKGKTAKEIAVTLGLSTRTIEYYLSNIKSKLFCSNKTELIMFLLKTYS